jgi:site-specific DNA-methyltransferase (adenine-specific)
MKDVWKLPAIAPWEKSCGKHPTQKPLSVLTRLILASTKPNAWILDPFTGVLQQELQQIWQTDDF